MLDSLETMEENKNNHTGGASPGGVPQFEEHLANIQEVFHAMNANGLKIKAKKCLLAMKEVTFLGQACC